MFIAGIDGGGTHTRLEIRNMENSLIDRKSFGPFNINSIGEEAFRKLLRQVFYACGDMTLCRKLCIGGAGISNPALERIIREELKKLNFTGAFRLCGDQEIALRGAMDEPGMVVIAGTGSICFGKNRLGETARSGGYGHLIDDGGSGYALGRDVLSAAVRTVDGREHCPELLEAVYHQLNARSPEEIVSFVYDRKTDKAAIAAFSSIAVRLAEQGSAKALEILDGEAGELSALVGAVKQRLELEKCPIALLGGLISMDNPYRRRVEEKLSAYGEVIYPAHDALWGAAQMAWEL